MDEQLEVALKGGEFRRLLESQFTAIRTKYDLKKIDIEVLFFLSKCNDENTPTDVYKRLKLNRGHVSQAIDILAKRGLIIAIPDRYDRRYMHYTISENAREIIREISIVRKNLDKQIFKGVTEKELLIYKEISEKIVRNIREMM